MRRAFLLAIAAVLIVAGLFVFEALQPRALRTHFPAGRISCYGHVYDAAYLAAHPAQQVAALYLSEKPSARGGNGKLNLTIAARFRDENTLYRETVECESDLGGAVCSRDCDIASFGLSTAGGSLAIDRRGRLSFVRLNSACGSGGGPVRHIDFKKEPADIRLDPLPASACEKN